MSSGDSYESGESHGKFFFHKYVSEICVNMAPCDVILCLDPIGAIIKTVPTLGSKHGDRASSSKESSKVVEEIVEVEPLLTSSNLPLIYADLACLRLFIPGQDNEATEQVTPKDFKTTLDHDMLLVQVIKGNYFFLIFTFI